MKKEKGDCEADERKRINSHAEKGDCVADEREQINETTIKKRLYIYNHIDNILYICIA